ncbi:MAG TPA: sugar ABC transporter permease [Chloroflexota bacterium]|nr:sugar ABC transporter permease [Chloroflexota bacterium]
MQSRAGSPAASPRSRASARIRRLADGAAPYGYLAPALLILGVFQLAPILYVIWLSFHKDTSFFGSAWVGAANYRRMAQDPEVGSALAATLKFMIGTVPVSTLIALGLALLLFEKLPGISAFRVIVLLPFITPVVATTVVWQWIFNPQYGFLDSLLYWLHLPTVDWFTSPFWAMIVLVAYTIWHEAGFTVLIMLAGLTNIPRELKESAQIDGANAPGRFLHLTLPLMGPWIFFVLVINVIGSFQVFTQVLTLTQGGPDRSTTIAGFLIEQTAFQFFDLPYAAAISTAVLLIVAVLTVLQFLIGNRRVFYQ